MNPRIATRFPPRASRRIALVAALAGAAGAVGALGGCATTGDEPTAQLHAARQAIDDAERAQAAEHAAPDLSQARTKLTAATTAVQAGDMDQAARLAEEAEADAELASARTAAVKAQAANDEIRKANSALLEELQRTRTGGTP
jgi:hypothetical protein